jgi:hypothetical protein
MIDYYLKAQDQFQFDALLIEAGLLDKDGKLMDSTAALDRIGEIVSCDNSDPPVCVVVPGYHANLRMMGDLTNEQKAALNSVLIDAPATPVRVWA